MSTPTDASSSVPPRRKRRWLTILVVLVVVLVGVLAVAPTVLSPFVRDKIVSELSQRTGGKAQLAELDLGWRKTNVAGLSLADDAGRPVFDVRQVAASYSLLALLTGGVEASLVAQGVDVHLRREGETWNLQKIVEKLGQGSSDDSDSSSGSDSKDGSLPSVVADVRVKDTNLIVHAPNSNDTTEIRDVAFHLALGGLDRSSPFDVSLLVSGPGQRNGARLTADGHVTARGANGDPSAFVTFDLEPLSLTTFGPVLAALGLETATPEGSLTGEGTWDWKGGLALDGRSSLTMRDARMVIEGKTLELAQASLTASAALDDAGSGTQTLRIEAGDLLDVDLDGTYDAAAGSLVGAAQASGALAEAFKTAAPWITLKDGVSVAGRWAVDGNWNVTGIASGGTVDALTANITADLSDLAARSAEGAPIDLGELTSVHLDIAADARAALSELDVSRLVVKAGPLDVDGTLSVAGLKSNAPKLRNSNVTYAADLGRLTELVGRVVDLGTLSLSGVLDGSLVAKGDADQVAVESTTKLVGFAASGLGDASAARSLGPFDVDARQVATIDPAGAIDVSSFSVTTPFATIGGRARVTPADDAEALPDATLRVDYTLRPTELQRHLGSWLPVSLDDPARTPITGDLDVTTSGRVVNAKGTFARPEQLAITLPPSDDGLTPARTIRTSNIRGDYTIAADTSGAAPVVTITKFDLASSTGSLSVKGKVALPLPDATTPLRSADLDITLGSSLANLWSDLADIVAASGGTAAGQGSWKVRATTTDGAQWKVTGDGGVDALALTLPINADDVSKPQQISIAPGRTDTTWDVGVNTDTMAVDITSLAGGWNGLRFDARGALRSLASLGDPSATTPARIESLQATVRYVPDRLQQWFGVLLPVTLSGADMQTTTLTVSGPLRLVEGDPLATLADLSVDADIGLGRASLPLVDVGGSLTADIVDGALALGSDVDVNGGKASLTLNGPLRDVIASVAGGSPNKATTISLNWNDVGADAKLGAALDNVHPLLASLDPQAGNTGFASRLTGKIDLSYAGALLPDALAGGIDFAAFSGDGRIALGDTLLAASPLLADMLTNLGGTGDRRFEIAPLEFSLANGTLRYDKPWSWNMGGVETSFTGAVNLDQSIDMRWSLPITKALADRHSFLARLQGESITIPLVGSLTAPRLAWDGVLSELADRAVKREFEGRIDDALPGLDIPGLGGLTGGSDKPGREDPKDLLAEADRLWDAGDTEEARKIYERLEDDFKYSLVVLANKDRIEDRAEKPKKKKLKLDIEEDDDGDEPEKKKKKKKDKKGG